jgi:hypothetical protein
MSTFRKKTPTAKQLGLKVATSWDEFEPSEVDGDKDADQSLLHAKYRHLIPTELLTEFLKEK